MLPDWPETKDKIAGEFLRFIRSETEARLGFLAEVKQRMVHEGDATVILRDDESRTEQGFAQMGANLEIGIDEFDGLPIPAVLERLKKVAEDLARARSEHAFSVLDTTCQEADNVVDAGGGPLSPDLILKTWETIEFAFDEQGQPRLPTLVVAPGQRDAVKKAIAGLEADADLRRRADDIIQRKREAWFAREANRTLVG